MTNPANTPKAVREALCVAQTALNENARWDSGTTSVWVDQIGELIEQIDVHRPIGPDGKHGDRHTPTCGCEGHRTPWSITLTLTNPEPGR